MELIPDDKRYFRIGEASRIIGVEPHVLRYWEGEFPQLRPRRADSRQRTYQRKDLEVLLEIKKLLYEDKLTIEGARKRLVEGPRPPKALDEGFLAELQEELRLIIKILST
ncbi:MerR family transcriptional regulator [Desulfatiglans anilini]|uniref:MerR family transcriptional regulator n=1 Tax=Desulfatiglans anilini TaxID=90728 RepID=UPI0004198427|nr:MerR family transcriptional regulator [Desulfatiglans anilini]